MENNKKTKTKHGNIGQIAKNEGYLEKKFEESWAFILFFTLLDLHLQSGL